MRLSDKEKMPRRRKKGRRGRRSTKNRSDPCPPAFHCFLDRESIANIKTLFYSKYFFSICSSGMHLDRSSILPHTPHLAFLSPSLSPPRISRRSEHYFPLHISLDEQFAQEPIKPTSLNFPQVQEGLIEIIPLTGAALSIVPKGGSKEKGVEKPPTAFGFVITGPLPITHLVASPPHSHQDQTGIGNNKKWRTMFCVENEAQLDQWMEGVSKSIDLGANLFPVVH